MVDGRSLVRCRVEQGSRVVLVDESDQAGWTAEVDGQPFEDLPELLVASGGDLDRILPGTPLSFRQRDVLSPIGSPRKIVCLGQNYRAHVAEAGRDESPRYPDLFPKWAVSLVGPFDDIDLPPESALVDYESELAVVIGRPARRVTSEQVDDVVFGYTAANDVSVRDFQVHTPGRTAGKAWDRMTPLGPRIVPAVRLGGADPDLRITGSLNGNVLQDSRTSNLIFSVRDIVTYLSSFMTLEPGDVILTGTPSGVGYFQEPRRMLRDGDVFGVEIEGIGALRNRFVDEQID